MSDERFILKNARHLAARYMEDILRRRRRRRGRDDGQRQGHGRSHANWWAKTGHVYAFDVQQEALERTAARLEEAGYAQPRDADSRRSRDDDANMCHVSPRVVMFNLGWLPGAEHVVTTKTETTHDRRCRRRLNWLLPDGFVSICVYPGHEEGTRELHALLDWAA